MKLLLVLCGVLACALAAAAPNTETQSVFPYAEVNGNVERNVLINVLIRQLIAYVRNIINNGSALLGIPPLDPLVIDDFELDIPAGLINLHLLLKDILMTGFGGFVVDRSELDLRALTFDIDIHIPSLDISAGEYDLVGDLYNAIPLYGKGPARFVVEGFSLQAVIHLKQSDDGQSVLIDRLENVGFQIPRFKCELGGVIGGGDIDRIVNAIVEDVLIGYINRFQGAISTLASLLVVEIANPILDQLDTWRFIAPLIPRN